MSKLFVELFFRQTSTESEVNFRKFLTELMENSEDLNPMPFDINAEYHQNRIGGQILLDHYHIIILTYEVGEESLFKLKKNILESIKQVDNKISASSFNFFNTKTALV